jgi:phosphosulfolactate phosphohydrolase-like enzyme
MILSHGTMIADYHRATAIVINNLPQTATFLTVVLRFLQIIEKLKNLFKKSQTEKRDE